VRDVGAKTLATRPHVVKSERNYYESGMPPARKVVAESSPKAKKVIAQEG